MLVNEIVVCISLRTKIRVISIKEEEVLLLVSEVKVYSSVLDLPIVATVQENVMPTIEVIVLYAVDQKMEGDALSEVAEPMPRSYYIGEISFTDVKIRGKVMYVPCAPSVKEVPTVGYA